jgi:hypothetical protein
MISLVTLDGCRQTGLDFSKDVFAGDQFIKSKPCLSVQPAMGTVLGVVLTQSLHRVLISLIEKMQMRLT